MKNFTSYFSDEAKNSRKAIFFIQNLKEQELEKLLNNGYLLKKDDIGYMIDGIVELYGNGSDIEKFYKNPAIKREFIKGYNTYVKEKHSNFLDNLIDVANNNLDIADESFKKNCIASHNAISSLLKIYDKDELNKNIFNDKDYAKKVYGGEKAFKKYLSDNIKENTGDNYEYNKKMLIALEDVEDTLLKLDKIIPDELKEKAAQERMEKFTNALNRYRSENTSNTLPKVP